MVAIEAMTSIALIARHELELGHFGGELFLEVGHDQLFGELLDGHFRSRDAQP
ncbi:MAG: hypothetical protein KGL39_31750 [Patescibacteria group bacterium]|nr:hypothetical protein [Patescibacteria group bacterium]